MDFLAGWFPSGPLTTLYALILLSAVIGVLWKGQESARTVAVAVLASWVVARTATVADLFVIQSMGTLFIAIFLLSLRDFLATVIACLAGLKLLVYTLFWAGQFSHIEQMWAWSEALGYIQILALMIGGSNVRGIRVRDWFTAPSGGRVRFVGVRTARRRVLELAHNYLGRR